MLDSGLHFVLGLIWLISPQTGLAMYMKQDFIQSNMTDLVVVSFRWFAFSMICNKLTNLRTLMVGDKQTIKRMNQLGATLWLAAGAMSMWIQNNFDCNPTATYYAFMIQCVGFSFAYAYFGCIQSDNDGSSKKNK